MLKITKLLIKLNIANISGSQEAYDKTLHDFGSRCWSLAWQGKLFTTNTKGEIVRVDGKKEV